MTEPQGLLGYSVLHEGLIGVFGSTGLKELTYANAVKPNAAKEMMPQWWLARFTDQYWATVLIPDQSKSYDARMFGKVDKQFFTKFDERPLTVGVGEKEATTTRMFAGAKEVGLLEQYTADQGIDRLNLLVDWGWFAFITEPMFHLMNFFTARRQFRRRHPADHRGCEASLLPAGKQILRVHEQDEEAAAGAEKIQERFKDDKPRQQQAMMVLYKKEKVNPMAGCLRS